MNRGAHLQLVDYQVYGSSLELVHTRAVSKHANVFDLKCAPPHPLVEEASSYSVDFKMHGVDQTGIGIDVDTKMRTITVHARMERANSLGGFFWTFAVPSDALLVKMSSEFSDGVLKIVIPKISKFLAEM